MSEQTEGAEVGIDLALDAAIGSTITYANRAEARRMLVRMLAEAWDEGRAAGYQEHGDDRLAGHGIIVGPPPANPYRAAAAAARGVEGGAR